jgi:hypothetical protein
VDQVGLPLDGGWYADHSLGHVSSLQVPIARGFGRLGLPTSAIEGASAQYALGDELRANVSLGEPGLYAGLGGNGFEGAGGRLYAGGLQWGPPAGGSALGLQVSHASGLGRMPGMDGVESVDAAWAGWRWEGRAPWAARLGAGAQPLGQRAGGLQLQLNVLASRSRTDAGTQQGGGAWADARWRTAWVEHSAGLFHLQPSLRWGTYNIASGLRGAYWRGEFASRQWLVGGMLETARGIGDEGQDGTYGSVNARWRMDTRDTLLGGVALRRGAGRGESLQAGWEHISAWGTTQWRADWVRGVAQRGVRLGVDHSFLVDDNGTLALALATEREVEDGVRKRFVTWGAVGSMRIGNGLTLDANLQGSHAQERRQLHGSVALAWRLSTHWSLIGQVSYTTGRELRQLAIVSPLNQAIETAQVANDFSARRAQLTLRYEEHRGRATAPLGGAPGMGAGGLAGYVFFDANDNGRREPGEEGVPDVVVRLDGRFVSRTDKHGLYEFPAVAAGAHRVEVVPDNVPLPWNLADGKAVAAQVRVRATTWQDFALRRDR